jgi:hypothetical protein
MTHRFRYYKCYPAGEDGTARRRPMRLVTICLAVGLLMCTAAIVILFVFVNDLRVTRNHEAAARQAAINRTFCLVLAQLPANSPELDRIRGQLHCAQPGLTPEQMKRMATTGGTP